VRPLPFDTAFTVECECTEIRGATFTFSYELRDAEGVCTRGTTRHACVDRARMRAVRVPEWLARAIREGEDR
jgi:acyl-CoA thioesterase FadM